MSQSRGFNYTARSKNYNECILSLDALGSAVAASALAWLATNTASFGSCVGAIAPPQTPSSTTSMRQSEVKPAAGREVGAT